MLCHFLRDLCVLRGKSINESLAASTRRAWRIARPVLVAYLLIVLGMMFLERWLVYPAPPLDCRRLEADRARPRRRLVRIGRWHEAARLVRAARQSQAGDPVLPRQRRAHRLQCRAGRPTCATRFRPPSSSSTTAATATARAGRAKPAASPMAARPSTGWPSGWGSSRATSCSWAARWAARSPSRWPPKRALRRSCSKTAFSTMPDVAAASLSVAARSLGHGQPLRLAVADPEVPRPAVPKPRHRRHAGPDRNGPPAVRRGTDYVNKKWIEFADLGHNSAWPDELLRRVGGVSRRLRPPADGADRHEPTNDAIPRPCCVP